MPDRIRDPVGTRQEPWLSPEVDALPPRRSPLSSVGSEGWPCSTPTGLVWAVQPAIRVVYQAPTWLAATICQLTTLLRLPPNWNSYGARPVALAAANRTVKLLLSLPSEIPAPSIVPTSRGHVQIEWHQSNLDIEVEVRPQETECFVAEGDDEEEFRVATQVDLLRLRAVLGRLM